LTIYVACHQHLSTTDQHFFRFFKTINMCISRKNKSKTVYVTIVVHINIRLLLNQWCRKLPTDRSQSTNNSFYSNNLSTYSTQSAAISWLWSCIKNCEQGSYM